MSTYSHGTASWYSETRDLDQLLQDIPDNTSNLIQPIHIRNSVWTLWDRIDGLSASVPQVGSFSTDYNRTTPIPIAVGGASVGTTFSGTVQDALDKILYPTIPPASSLSVSGATREFGSSNAVTLTGVATKNTNNILSVQFTRVSPAGLFTPVAIPTTSSYNTATLPATQDVNTSYTFTVSDGVSNVTSNASVTWMNRRYWGTHTSFSLPSNAQILALSGAGIGSGSELSSTRVQTRNGINGGGNYLVFAWPTSFGNPTFTVNGLPNTAWTKIGNAISFTNAYGYVNTYDVWISNTAQNSPIALFSIT